MGGARLLAGGGAFPDAGIAGGARDGIGLGVVGEGVGGCCS